MTADALKGLLTRIGSASSGTKSTLLARFQRDVRQSGVQIQAGASRKPCERTLRIMSIDMGIRNLAFCDAEVTYPALGTQESDLDAAMKVLRWRKIDLVSGKDDQGARSSEDGQAALEPAEDDENQYSPSVLSRTAYRLITEEVLSASPDVILIEKQRWRSGGGSAVQQWTVRVNTLEAMLWAILETLKSVPEDPKRGSAKRDYRVYAVDPKRVGQYWLSRHARALQEKNEGISSPSSPESPSASPQRASRSKAEKSAKIALLRAWLAPSTLSTAPSSPAHTPRIALAIAPAAEATRAALLPRAAAPRRRTKGAGAALGVPAEMKKLDDVTDCFLQAAAWVAWELNRAQLVRVGGEGRGAVDEVRILRMLEAVGGG